jgi:DNA-binding transcriptional regulator LsrR (DeoR family)
MSVAVGRGRAKLAPKRGCLCAKYMNVLVTDEQTAHFLLNEKENG